MPHLEEIERGQRRQLPADRGRAHMRLHRRQHRHRAGPARRGQAQPGHELADVLQPHLAPVELPLPGEDPVILQVMGISLDRVRGPLDRGQVGQVPLDRLDRCVVVAQDGPRLNR